MIDLIFSKTMAQFRVPQDAIAPTRKWLEVRGVRFSLTENTFVVSFDEFLSPGGKELLEKLIYRATGIRVKAEIPPPPAEELPVEESPIEEPPVEESPVEESPVEESPAEELPVEEPPVAICSTTEWITATKETLPLLAKHLKEVLGINITIVEESSPPAPPTPPKKGRLSKSQLVKILKAKSPEWIERLGCDRIPSWGLLKTRRDKLSALADVLLQEEEEVA
jgi:hypothetical protein